jgi:hypothetical protein
VAYRTSSIDRPLPRPGHRRRGFSVAEGLIASTILAMAVVGIAGPLGAASQQGKLVRERATALILARELMEEVAAKPLLDGGGSTCSLGPESGETDRSKYDSADDYHNYHDDSTDLRDLAGRSITLTGSGLYTRDVTVNYRTTTSGANTTSGDLGVVTVTVVTPHKLRVKLTRLLCKQQLTY